MAQKKPVHIIRCGEMVIFTTPLPGGPVSPFAANPEFSDKIEIYTPEPDYFVVMIDTSRTSNSNDLINAVILHAWSVLQSRGIVGPNPPDIIIGEVVRKLLPEMLHPDHWLERAGIDPIPSHLKWPNYDEPVAQMTFNRLYGEHVTQPMTRAHI